VNSGVCAVHAVMLGGESPLSGFTWSRRTREAQGRHRELGSEGSVERMRNVFFVSALIALALITGCASVPMASKTEDTALKSFAKPGADKAGLYIYRNSFAGQALKKNVYADGILLGETAHKVYFYKEIAPGQHQLSTESEFSDNAITFQAQGGNNYFAEQYIKMGVFVGGAGLKMASEEEGMKNVRECSLAK